MIKSIISKLIGPTTVFRARRFVRKVLSKRPNYSSTRKLNVISRGYHTTCGYYDLNPERDDKLLYGVANKDMSSYDIMLEDRRSGKISKVDTTNAINWQQGCRLKWIGKDIFIYNMYDGATETYYSIEMNGGKKKKHRFPIYDATNEYGVSLDFVRLGHLRPGYGYTKIALKDVSEDSVAITVFGMNDDSVIKEIFYRDIIQKTGLTPLLSKCYINHVSISPDGKQFLFFFVEIQGNRHMCYLMVYRNGEIILLEETLSASHYTWMDNENILVTAYDAQHNCRYYVYNSFSRTRVPFMGSELTQDGHPTRISSNKIITDTYPDREGFQYVKLVDIEDGTIEVLASVYSTAKHIGEYRCDLHPRYSPESSTVYFDADTDGHRKICEIKLGESE